LDTPLAGTVALVTGAGAKGEAYGTGRATAVALARAGADLVLVDRHQDRADATGRLVAGEGRRAVTVVADLGGESDCIRSVQAAVDAFGRLDTVVANAARFVAGSIFDTTEETFNEAVAVNLTVPFMLAKHALPVMIEHGGGSFVFVSTVVALRGPSTQAYAATKAGLEGLTVSLATTFGPQGVRANTVIPGMIDTPMRAASIAAAGLDEATMTVGTATATGRSGDAWDIANAVVFLASPAAKHITGVMLPVDGGATVRLP
jgi:NAD(P)-dependent dehydrogenase (short-subunit alcohol dehydrogenase family)